MNCYASITHSGIKFSSKIFLEAVSSFGIYYFVIPALFFIMPLWYIRVFFYYMIWIGIFFVAICCLYYLFSCHSLEFRDGVFLFLFCFLVLELLGFFNCLLVTGIYKPIFSIPKKWYLLVFFALLYCSGCLFYYFFAYLLVIIHVLWILAGLFFILFCLMDSSTIRLSSGISILNFQISH